jgi:FlaA1/EpsC-like NDP-sugar epimerase
MNKMQEFISFVIRRLMKFSLVHRWLVYAIDLALCLAAFALAVVNRVRILGNEAVPDHMWLGLTFVLFCSVTFAVFKSYRGLVRHSNFQELWRLFVADVLASVALYIVLAFFEPGMQGRLSFIQNVFLFSLVSMLFIRFWIIVIYNYAMQPITKRTKKTLIYGIDTHSIALSQWIKRSVNNQQVQGFLTRNKDALNTRIQGLDVYGIDLDHLEFFLIKNDISIVLFPDYKSVRKEQDFIAKCRELQVSVLVSPPFEGVSATGQAQFQMKPIQFEDLLGREEITIDMERIAGQLRDKVILITGAAGSIGSELVRQLAVFRPSMLLLFDMAETPLHNLRLEMERTYPMLKFLPIIGDVRSKTRLDHVFSKFRPEVVYHAAAYKHVPMMEENPCEAALVNISGTLNVSNLAVKYGAGSFVMISTDKAVNPTNIMGASKRIAEIYVQALAKQCAKMENPIRFVTTRFGNVLGSNGSVIPHFKEQIEKGGPVTVTHPDIIRYFMTIPEACRLVLEAASFGKTGEIYVFDMGQPVKILDLAKKMIELAGLVPEKDISIEYIGLRPGEKLYEELLNDKEVVGPTVHKKIMVAKVRQYELEKVDLAVKSIVEAAMSVNVPSTVLAMKHLVPEFKSQNSPYEAYDKKD